MKKSYKRTPRNYNGISSPHKEIKEILPSLLFQIEKSSFSSDHTILSAWPEIIGEKLSSFTEAVSFKEGVLFVKVKTQTLYSLLCQHEKERLLHVLQKKFPDAQIRKIVFRMG